MKKKVILLMVTSLLSTAAYAQGIVTMTIVNGTNAGLAIDPFGYGVQDGSNVRDTKVLSMPLFIATSNSAFLVVQKLGPKFEGFVGLVPVAVDIGGSIDWQTKNGVTRFWTVSVDVFSSQHSTNCSPATWDGNGDFQTTCIATK